MQSRTTIRRPGGACADEQKFKTKGGEGVKQQAGGWHVDDCCRPDYYYYFNARTTQQLASK